MEKLYGVAEGLWEPDLVRFFIGEVIAILQLIVSAGARGSI